MYAAICSRDFAPHSPETLRHFHAFAPAFEPLFAGPLLLLCERGSNVPTAAEGSVTVCGDGDAMLALAEYRVHGPAFVERLTGEFTFVLVDRDRRLILAATDRLGLRPLYYAEAGNDWIFSPVASLVAQHPRYRFQADEMGIAQSLFGIERSDGRTFYRGISRLLPATILSMNNGRIESRRYWSPRRGANNGTSEDAPGILRRMLIETIGRHHRRGKTGLLLSGGLDSSSIACLAAEAGLDLRTYSLAFPGDSTGDERDLIEMVVRRYGFAHRWVELPAQMPREISLTGSPGIPDLAYRPNLQMHAPQFAQMQQDGVEVCLNGIGGDQMFGAEPYAVDFGQGWSWAELRRGVLSPLAPRILRWARRRRDPQALLHAMRLDFALRSRIWRYLEPARLPSAGGSAGAATIDSVFHSASLRRAVEDLALLGHSFGIATAAPLLDAGILEFVASLSVKQDRAEMQSKGVLREAVKGIVPEPIRLRTGKAHFTRWFDHDLRQRQGRSVLRFLEAAGPAHGLMTAQGRAAALQYARTKGHPAGRWICTNWLNVQRWWNYASEGALYARERQRERQEDSEAATNLAEAGSEILG